MFEAILLLVMLVGLHPSKGMSSRSVLLSEDEGSVNLVEVNINGKLYGRCQFVDNGELIELIFEEMNGNLRATAKNPTIMDPISKASLCRDVASRPISSEAKFRSSLGDGAAEESPEQIANRLIDLERNLASNKEYISDLRPRFIGFMNSFSKDYLITFGNDNTDTRSQDLSLSLPHTNYNKVGIAFPFRMFQHYG